MSDVCQRRVSGGKQGGLGTQVIGNQQSFMPCQLPRKGHIHKRVPVCSNTHAHTTSRRSDRALVLNKRKPADSGGRPKRTPSQTQHEYSNPRLRACSSGDIAAAESGVGPGRLAVGTGYIRLSISSLSGGAVANTRSHCWSQPMLAGDADTHLRKGKAQKVTESKRE